MPITTAPRGPGGTRSQRFPAFLTQSSTNPQRQAYAAAPGARHAKGLVALPPRGGAAWGQSVRARERDLTQKGPRTGRYARQVDPRCRPYRRRRGRSAPVGVGAVLREPVQEVE